MVGSLRGDRGIVRTHLCVRKDEDKDGRVRSVLRYCVRDIFFSVCLVIFDVVVVRIEGV